VSEAALSAKRPSEMTEAELIALPVGPDVRRERPITAEDRARGMHGRSVVTYEAKQVRCNAYLPTDIIWWYDPEGRAWMFGQWADGTWFRQPIVLG
jgi:hypothetical protein